MSKKITAAVILVLVLLLAVIVKMVSGIENTKEETQKVVVGLVLPGDRTEVGWNGDHYQNAKDAADELGVELLVRDNVAEGSGTLETAVKSLADSGSKLILLASFNYPEEMFGYMKDHKDITFFGLPSESGFPNYKAYAGRAYQARFLAGVIASLNSKSGKLGYVGAMSNSEVNRGINAFALGARRVNPKAKVYVAWTNSWDDEAVERENVDKLVKDYGVDALGYHQNRYNVIDEAEKLGVMTVAYSMKQSSYSPNVLASTATSWKSVYREVIRDFLQQKNSVSNYWVGADKGAIEIPFFSTAVSDSAKLVINGYLDSLKNGMDVFAGPIYDNHHKKRCDKNEVVSDMVLRGEMDWFVDGVTIYETR